MPVDVIFMIVKISLNSQNMLVWYHYSCRDPFAKRKGVYIGEDFLESISFDLHCIVCGSLGIS